MSTKLRKMFFFHISHLCFLSVLLLPAHLILLLCNSSRCRNSEITYQFTSSLLLKSLNSPCSGGRFSPKEKVTCEHVRVSTLSGRIRLQECEICFMEQLIAESNPPALSPFSFSFAFFVVIVSARS